MRVTVSGVYLHSFRYPASRDIIIRGLRLFSATRNDSAPQSVPPFRRNEIASRNCDIGTDLLVRRYFGGALVR